MNSVEAERSHPSAHLVAGTLILVAILNGCSLLDGSGTQTSEQTCGDRDWCYNEDDYIEGSYDRSISLLYCYVQQTRERVTNDEIDLDDLPKWADRSYRNGAPIVIDLSTAPAPEFDQRLDDLKGHFREAGNPLNPEQARACNDELTQRRIESTDGQRRAG